MGLTSWVGGVEAFPYITHLLILLSADDTKELGSSLLSLPLGFRKIAYHHENLLHIYPFSSAIVATDFFPLWDFL